MSDKDQAEEPQEECGFCIFMKGGGCKDAFTDWSDCVDKHREGEGDFTEECKNQTIALQECMIEHNDYYKDFIAPGAGEGTTESALAGSGGQGSDDKNEKSSSEPSKSDKPESSEKTENKPSTENKQEAKDDSSKQDEGKSTEGAPQKSSKTEEDQGEKKSEQPSKESQDEQSDNRSSKDEGEKKNDKAGGDSDKKDSNDKSDGDDEGKGKTTSKSGAGDVAGTPAEKHAKAATETANKQERIKDQESHPVKAKPDESKKEKADKETPESETSKSESSEGKDNSKDDSEEDSNEEEEEEEEEKPEIKVQTAPADVRFVTTNQARHCYTRYQEYHKCAQEKGEDNSDCKFFQRAYRALCPGDWVDRWNEQREEGTFAGRY